MRTVIDIDDDLLRIAAEELGTTSKVATVNAALRVIANQRASREMMATMMSLDLDVSLDAWQMDHKSYHPQGGQEA